MKSYYIPVSHRPNIFYRELELRRAVSQPRASGVFLSQEIPYVSGGGGSQKWGGGDAVPAPTSPLPSPPPPFALQLRNHFISSG